MYWSLRWLCVVLENSRLSCVLEPKMAGGQETGDKYTVRSFMSVIRWGDQFKKNDMEWCKFM